MTTVGAPNTARRRSDFRELEQAMVTTTLALRVATVKWRDDDIEQAVRSLVAARKGIEYVLCQVGEIA